MLVVGSVSEGVQYFKYQTLSSSNFISVNKSAQVRRREGGGGGPDPPRTRSGQKTGRPRRERKGAKEGRKKELLYKIPK